MPVRSSAVATRFGVRDGPGLDDGRRTPTEALKRGERRGNLVVVGVMDFVNRDGPLEDGFVGGDVVREYSRQAAGHLSDVGER